MSFPYKNPISGVIVAAPSSVLRQSVGGTNFSVLSVGGYMEVWSLSDLNFSTFGATGNITNSGNTIPVQFYKRPAPAISDRLTINADAISSGRRRLGMLVYVHENDTTYQHSIDNYETLWNAAAAVTGVISTADTSYTVYNRVSGSEKPEGQALIAAWTGSTVEGVSGATRSGAQWKIYYGPQVYITGGTYDSGTTTLSLFNSSGGTLQVTGFTSGGAGTTVTGGTFDINTGDLTINNSDNTSVTITGFTNVYVTGGTLSGGTLQLENSTGGTASVTGFTLLEYVTYDETLTLNTGSRLIDSQPLSDYSMLQYNYVLGDGTNYRSGTFTITSDRNNIAYSEIATQSVGYTKDVVLSAITNGGNIEFRGSFPSDDWQINFVRTSVPVIDLGPVPSLTPTPTPTPTSSPIPVTPSVTPTLTPTSSITPTPSVTPSITPSITVSPSITPSITPTNTITPTPSATVLEYELAVATPFTGSTTVSWTDPYGNPASASLTQPNVGGYTFCALAGLYTLPPEITLAKAPIPCPVFPTPSPTATPTATPTPTVTPSISLSATITPTPSITPSLSVSSTNTPTPTTTVTPSISVSATITPTPSITPTQSVTPTSTITPTPTVTPSISLSATQTPTPSITPTITPSITPSISVSATITPTPSITPTITPSLSLTATQTPTPTPTITPTASPIIPLLTVSNSNATVSLTDVSFSGTQEPLESGSYPITVGQSGYSLTHAAVSGVGPDILTYTVNATEGESFTGVVSKNGTPVDTIGPAIQTYPYTRNVPGSFLSGDTIDIQIS